MKIPEFKDWYYIFPVAITILALLIVSGVLTVPHCNNECRYCRALIGKEDEYENFF